MSAHIYSRTENCARETRMLPTDITYHAHAPLLFHRQMEAMCLWQVSAPNLIYKVDDAL